MNIEFKRITARSDLKLYQVIAEREMSPEDLVTGEELKEFILSGKGESWFVFVNNNPVPAGWCAILNHGFFNEPVLHQSTHILGVLVLEKGKGIGKEIIKWIIENFKNEDLTAAITPKNKPSIHLFQSLGFINQGEISGTPWELWQRKHIPAHLNEGKTP